MRITDLLDKRSISLTGAPKTKQEALDQVIDLMIKSGRINDEEAYRKQALDQGVRVMAWVSETEDALVPLR